VSEFERIAVAVVLAVLAQSPQGTQPPSSSQQPRFRGGTNMVRVDVFATKAGVPVQDLTAADFELVEDNRPQKIDSFEHVVITPATPGERVDPSSVTQAIQAAADPHRRVFVIYLDIEHVDVTGSHDIKQPLIDFMNRVMSNDDLVGIMTPEMGPQQITFARKTDVIERGLTDNWIWGRRDTIVPDDREKLYQECFPPTPRELASGGPSVSHLATEMTLRRREKMVLDSLYDLAHYMETIRDGRTAVVTVSDGWVLYRPDPSLSAPRMNGGSSVDPMPGTPPPVGVGGGGTLGMRPPNASASNQNADQTECDKDRMALANLDDAQYFKDLLGDANRASLSFYTIDPRGFAAEDLGVNPSEHGDSWKTLDARHESLRVLSLNTDGLALIASNDLHQELRRIADDLTSYYLLGYYSTNSTLDGRYRTIKVRATRPGIEVRARPGYRAATAAEVNAATRAAEHPVAAEKDALTHALSTIETDARAHDHALARGPGEPLLFHRGPSTGNQMQPAPARIFPRSDRLHLELEAAAAAPVWTGVLLDRNGTKTVVPVVAGDRTDAATGQRWVTADVTLAPLGAGDYIIELTSTAGTEQRRTLVAIRVTQ
jgi:VWFA-related protein